MKTKNKLTRQLSQKRDVAFAGSHVICVVFLMLFLVLPALAAHAERSEDNPLPETSDAADPEAVASGPDGDRDVTEPPSEDIEIAREDEEKGIESPSPSSPSADPNAIASIPEEGTDITELLAEDKQNIAQQASAEQARMSDPNQIQKADPNSLPVSDPNKSVQEPSPSADPNRLAGTEGSRDVTELLAESKKMLPRAWFEDEVIMKLLTPYTIAKTYLHEEWSLDTAMEHVLIYQRATGGRRPREQAVYNFTYFGVWNISKFAKDDIGVVGFSFEERDNITDHSVREFSQGIGVNYRTHGLNTDERSRTALRQLWWRRTLLDKSITVTAGKLHHSSYYNRNSFAGNSRTSFLSNPFARNPNRLTPQDGLGANVTLKPNDDYYFSAGFGDAEADNTTSGFDSAGDGHFFTAAEIGLTPTIEGAGEGNYRFTFWQTNQADDEAASTDNDGSGFALSFDQELNKTVGLFARYGYTEPQVTDIKNFVSGGFVLRDPEKIRGDRFGVGLSWDQPSNGADEEVSMEIFQRIQFTSRVQITPSLLIIFDPSQSEKTEPVAVFGIRFRALF
ncbi:MAG: carbohydrate porin [Anaerohalosphaeraceae bacterium]